MDAEAEARIEGRIYLREGELAALTREAHGADNGRVVPLAFGASGAWLSPAARDADGNYPRWIVLRLAVLRGLDLTSARISDAERDELSRFAAEHGKEVIA